MKNLFNLIFVGLVAFSLTSCGGSSSSDKERIAELEAQIAELQNNSNNTSSQPQSSEVFSSTSSSKSSDTPANFVGKYKVVDRSGNIFYFIINQDETANVKAEGSDVTLYCSWSDLISINLGIRIDFSDKRPIISFEGGIDRKSVV